MGLFLLILLPGTDQIFAQEKSTYFSGGIETGIGISHFFGLNKANNKFSLPHLAFHGGIFSSRYISPHAYIEFGLFGSRQGYDFKKETCNGEGCFNEKQLLNLYYIDFPISYYHEIAKLRDWRSSFYIGLTNSVLINYKMEVSDSESMIPRAYFRDHIFSVCTGLAFGKNSLRLRLHSNLAIQSIVWPILNGSLPFFPNNSGSGIFPIEILISCGYIFR